MKLLNARCRLLLAPSLTLAQRALGIRLLSSLAGVRNLPIANISTLIHKP